MAAIQYLLWLSTRRGLPPRSQVELLEYFGGAERVYFADRAGYEPFALTGEARAALCDKSLDGAERILERCDRLGLYLLSCQDAAYPERLLQLSDYPLVLYGKGRLFRFDEEPAIAVVGARACTPYGVKMAGRLAMDLARSGALVVSGLAQGIDAAALKGALQGGGRAVSVLAGGVDVVYPACNGWLYEDVAARGAVLSESPPGTRPQGWRFPMRNRIIAGLSSGVLCVEAGVHSGTLITADAALEQGRSVMAIPGRITDASALGCLRLIKNGARLVDCPEDVLDELSSLPGFAQNPASSSAAAPAAALPQPPKPAAPRLLPIPEHATPGERRILECLTQTSDPLSADELQRETGLPAAELPPLLIALEMKCLLRRTPGNLYTR